MPSTDEPLTTLIRGMRRGQLAQDEAREARRQRAWAVARKGAALLRQSFGVSEVRLFGSLVEDDGHWFGAGSDIDLAVSGLAAEDYFLAVGKLQGLSTEFSVDLVDIDRCPEHLRGAVNAGVAL